MPFRTAKRRPQWTRITKRHSEAGRDALKRLRSFLDTEEPELVQLLARLWHNQEQAITYREIRGALLNGYMDTATLDAWRQDYAVFVNEKLRPAWVNAMREGAAHLSEKYPDFSFDFATPGVRDWLSVRGGELITVISEEQRQAIAAMVNRAYPETWTVDELARAIRPTIGLNIPQAAANLRYYEHVRTSLLKNNPSMREATAAKRAREASVRYAEKQHRYRAFMIARTELAFAYNRGQDEGVKQAIAQGYMGMCVKVWSTADDERTCSICEGLEGTEIGMDGEFDFSEVNSRVPSGPTPPAHPNCRCAVEYREIAPPVRQRDSYSAMGGSGFAENSNYSLSNDLTEYPNPDILSERPKNEPEILRRFNRYTPGAKTDDEKLKQINPTGDRDNCQRCVVAYEMLERGYDVIAKSFNPLDSIGYNGFRAWKFDADNPALDSGLFQIVRKEIFQPVVKGCFDIWGDGARAVIRIEWSEQFITEGERGHFIVAKRIGNDILYIDPQIAEKRDISLMLRACTNEKGRMWIMRIDNREFSDAVVDAVQNRE